ncbi:Coiled-coil domain-containing protein 22 [Parelaphostrongylus tenuis]|uniref:Coiled-coil domain-containing protein 22 homolog n=1 Tax=Parelaphostrongylus tenuis TaxID=148309 RepID=A0AAD5MBM8_PARTN|nr:Coiled-coil domain-containing protein 22 [Parelaphostrongylus tenuis]
MRLRNQQPQQGPCAEQETAKNREKLEKLRYEILQNNHIAEEMTKRLENTRKRDVDRVLIVRRIMEMTASIQKQNEEINKRELKWLTQTLHRTFTTIEEALFKEVEDQKGEQAYKLFGKLHLSCMASVEAIERNGALVRQNEELIDLIEIEKQNRFDDQLKRIQADLDVIVMENKKLENVLAKDSI